MSDIRPITLFAEMQTIFEIEENGFLSISQDDHHGVMAIIEISPRQIALLMDYLTTNIEAMHSRAASYGGQ